jgi:hypothetical protein
MSVFEFDLARTYIASMKRNSDDLNFVQAASALAIDQAGFSNLLKQKRFIGRRSGNRSERLISRDDLAALFGRILSDVEFARARLVKAKDYRKTSKQLEVNHAD